MRFRKTTILFLLGMGPGIALSAWGQHNVAPNFSSAHADLVVGVRTVGAELKFSATTADADPARGISAATPASGEAKPFTQEQVKGMVRDGLGDETGAKAIEQRGIDFAPSEDFLGSLKSAGANEAFLAALRAAKRPQPAGGVPKKPLNQVQVFALLAGQVPSHRVTMLVEERGIDFEPTDDYLQEVQLAGGEDELIRALKVAEVMRSLTDLQRDAEKQLELDRHLARGGEFFRHKRYAEAETEYRAALRLEPRDADLHMALGAAMANKGELDAAAAEEREALRLNTNEDLAHYNLGVILGKRGDRDGEIAEYREALRINPDNERTHVNLGLALDHRGDLEGAVAQYREALRLDPELAEAHNGLGNALFDKGDLDGAIAEYREALRLKPEYDVAHNNLGLALGNKGDLDAAIAEHREAIRLNPHNADAHASLGLLLGGKGDLVGAEGEFRSALRLNPRNPKAHYYLGHTLEGKDDRAGALAEYRAAYELDPQDPDIRQAYERLLQEVQR